MKWYIIPVHTVYNHRPYRFPKIKQALSRILGLAIMFGGGFVIGQVIRGIILGLLF